MMDIDAWVALWRRTAIAAGMPPSEAECNELLPEIRGYYSSTRNAEESAKEYMATVYET